MSGAPSLAELIAEAANLMQERSGGQAVCTFTKAGQAVPGLKYAEGRWAALREVQHNTRSGAELAEVVATAAAAWGTHLDRLEARSAGADWIAYRSGGTDALTELSDTLRREGGAA